MLTNLSFGNSLIIIGLLAKRNCHSHNIEFSLCLLYYAEACNEWRDRFHGSSFGEIASSCEETALWWRAIGNTVSNLICSGIESKTCRIDSDVVSNPELASYFSPSV